MRRNGWGADSSTFAAGSSSGALRGARALMFCTLLSSLARRRLNSKLIHLGRQRIPQNGTVRASETSDPPLLLSLSLPPSHGGGFGACSILLSFPSLIAQHSDGLTDAPARVLALAGRARLRRPQVRDCS